MREYFQILKDTLIGFLLEPYRKTAKRKPVAAAKFYLFDAGVAAFLRKRGDVEPGSEAYGRALEHLIFLELRAYLDYSRKDAALHYWRTLSQIEVDFVLDGVLDGAVAIEVKAGARVSRRDWKPMLALGEELPLRRRIVVCLESERRVTDDGVEIVPVVEFLDELWAGGIV